VIKEIIYKEKIGVENIDPGTTEKLEKIVKERGFIKKNGKPNISGFLRYLIYEEIKKG
jgi:hypothetical protein